MIICGAVFIGVSLFACIAIHVWAAEAVPVMYPVEEEVPYKTLCIVLVWFVWVATVAIGFVSITEWAKTGAFLPSSMMICYLSFCSWIMAVQRTDHPNSHLGRIA